MNSFIKYGLYFVVVFSVLAFGAAEDEKEQRSAVYAKLRRAKEVGSQPSTHPPCSRTVAAGSYVVPRRSDDR